MLLLIILLAIALFVFLNAEMKKTKPYADEIFKSATTYNIAPSLIFAVIRAESNFDTNAISQASAKGLMQIIPKTAKEIAQNKGVAFDENILFDYKTNIDFGCYYLKQMMDKSNNTTNALASYNAGIGTVEKWLNNIEYSKDGKALDIIPYKETRTYVEKIAVFQKIYNFLIPIYYK